MLQARLADVCSPYGFNLLNLLLHAYVVRPSTAQTKCDHLILFFIVLDSKRNIFEVWTVEITQGQCVSLGCWK